MDLSNALEYLHHNNQGTIIHCDLKPSNILLDDNMIAHVGDFGLVKFRTDSSTSFGDSNSIFSLAIKGTIGYIAPGNLKILSCFCITTYFFNIPSYMSYTLVLYMHFTECAEGDQVSTASDVYSFGVVLLELFIRRRPIDAMFKDGLSIAKFTEINFSDRILEIVDPQLQQELDLCLEAPVEVKEKDIHCMLSVLKIGIHCTKPIPSECISMREAAAKLHIIKDAYLRGN